MIKTMFAFGALALAVAAPAAAQMAAGGALPKCSATVRDSCDQSMTTEKNAMTAEQAMKTGGVGDRRSDGATMPADHAGMMPADHRMMHGRMTKKQTMMHKKMMMQHDMAPTDPTASPAPM